MFSRATVFVWVGIILLSSIFLMGQETWGPQEKIVFVTDGVYTGDLGGLVGADAICQYEADGAGLPGTYKAWLSDDVTGPSTRFNHSDGPYVLVDGTQVAADWTDLVDGHLEGPINVSATGVGALNSLVWTNTATDANPKNWTGQPFHDCCDYWYQDVTVNANVGWTNSITSVWTAFDYLWPCDEALRLYCFQQ